MIVTLYSDLRDLTGRQTYIILVFASVFGEGSRLQTKQENRCLERSVGQRVHQKLEMIEGATKYWLL